MRQIIAWKMTVQSTRPAGLGKAGKSRVERRTETGTGGELAILTGFSKRTITIPRGERIPEEKIRDREKEGPRSSNSHHRVTPMSFFTQAEKLGNDEGKKGKASSWNTLPSSAGRYLDRFARRGCRPS